ncbi:site-specific integrase [Thiomicrorhabdus hydrogeniphila]
MPKMTLDGQFVRSVQCPTDKNKIDYYDTAIIGFILEVRKTGGKTYYLRYRDIHGKQKQYKIGDANAISFDKARNHAQTLKAKVVLGESPSEQRQKKRNIPTLAQFSQERYMPFAKGYKRSWATDESFLRLHILPKFGHFPIDQIQQEKVIEFLYEIRDQGYALSTANHIVALLRYIFNLAKKWKVPGGETSPLEGMKLFEINNGRERFLTPDETKRLYATIHKSVNTQLKYIVPLLLLLGFRRGELFNARWEDVNIDKRTWRVPMSKTGKSRHVPLSKAAIDVLEHVPRFEGCPYVVPNPKTLKPFNDIFQSWDTARKRAGLPDVRMHDLRHSMASNLVNSGRSIYEVAKILGHSQIQTSQRYAHLSQDTLLAAVDAAAEATGTKWEN